MSYKVIRGKFDLVYQSPKRRVGNQPDGDSFWFKPNDIAKHESLNNRKIIYNGGDSVQLRFEGIDALELHYRGFHQNIDLAVKARDYVLEEAGFTDIEYSGPECDGCT